MTEEALPPLNENMPLEVLISYLHHEKEAVHYAAADAITRKGRPGLEFALDLARHPVPQFRDTACYILGGVGWNEPDLADKPGHFAARYVEALPTLIDLLENDPHPNVQVGACFGLCWHQHPDAIPSLLRASQSPIPMLRYAATNALGCFYFNPEGEQDPPYKATIEAALQRLMDDEDEDIRDWATFGIHQGNHNTPESQARLWRALDDPEPNVRGEAAVALALFRAPLFATRLKSLLQEERPPLLFFEAAEALADPALLPIVLEAEERWHEQERSSEKDAWPVPIIRSAIEALERAAAKEESITSLT